MPTVPRFYLIPNRDGVSEIYLKYTYSKLEKRLEFYTGWRVESGQWDKSIQRCRTDVKNKNAADINRDLNKLEVKAIEYVRVAVMQKAKINQDRFKAILGNEIGKITKHEVNAQPIAYFERFVTERKASGNYALGSLTVYNTTMKHLTAYAEAKRISYTWGMFDHTFFKEYTEWLYAKGFKDNHVNKVTSNLVTMLRHADANDISPELKMRHGLVCAPKTIPDKIYLTEEDLSKLRNIVLSPRMSITRDFFLIGCYTGLRYSDFSRLKKDNIRKETDIEGNTYHYLEIVTQKTGERVVIPLRAQAVALICRYDEMPKAATNQKFNENIKEIAMLAGLTDNIISSHSHRGKRSTSIAKKYELITTHTARRTFATNAYLAGIPIKFIMSITGHTTEKEFIKYLKIKAYEHAVIIAKHQFFK